MPASMAFFMVKTRLNVTNENTVYLLSEAKLLAGLVSYVFIPALCADWKEEPGLRGHDLQFICCTKPHYRKIKGKLVPLYM